MAEERVYIKLSGDARGAVAAARQSEAALQQVKAKAQSLAETQVAGDARAREAHAALLAQYRRTAAAAVEGSAEQASALKLVAREERALGVQVSENTRRVSLFGREVRGVERGALAGSGAMTHFGRSLAFASTAFIGTAGLTQLIRDSVKEAANLNAEEHRTDVTFKGSARTIKAWSKTTADAFGLARAESLKWANQFGAMMRAVGVGEAEAARRSRALVERAADIASLRNIDPTVVLTAFTQGLAGRGRGLRQYGIVLDETRLKAEALSSGIVKSSVDIGKVKLAEDAVAIATAKLADAQSKYGANTVQVHEAADRLTKAHAALEKAVAGSTGKLTNQQKTLAAERIIMQDSAVAAGQFGKNHERAGEQLKILHAQIKGVEEELGLALIPVLTRLARHMTAWLADNQNQARVQRDIEEAVRLVTAAFQALYAIGKALTPVIESIDAATGGLKHTMELLLALAVARRLALWTLAFKGLGASAGAAGAAGEVSLLRSRLLLLGRMAPIVIPIIFAYETLFNQKKFDRGVTKFLQKHGLEPKDFQSIEDIDRAIAKAKMFGDDTQVQLLEELRAKLIAAGMRPSRPAVAGTPGSSVGSATMGSPQRAGTPTAQGRAKQQAVVATAQKLGPASGDVYVTGGSNIKTGYDCSGYLYDIYKRNGITIPRTSEGQWNDPNAIRVAPGDEAPGDGLYFTGSSKYPPPGHCGIYIGGGRYIEYYSSGKPAKVSRLADATDYWGARRWIKVVQTGAGPTGGLDAGAAGAPRGAGAGAGPGKRPPKKPDPLVVGKRTGANAPGLAIVPGKLTAEQETVANLIYATAIAQGATAIEALAMVAAAYAESKLNPRAAGGGLFQINAVGNPKVYARYMALLKAGYDPTTAAVMAMVATYIAVGKAHPKAGAAEIAALAERPNVAAVRRAGFKSAADFEGQALGSIFGFGDSGGYGISGSKSRAQTPAQRKAAVTSIGTNLPGLMRELAGLAARGVISPQDEAVYKARAAALRKLIAQVLANGTVTPAELAKVKKQWHALQSSLKAGIEEAIKEAATAKLMRALIRSALKDGLITDDELALIDSRMAGLNDKVAMRLKKLVKTIEDQRSKIDDATGKINDAIMAAFDENVVGRVAGLRTYGAAQLGRATTQKTIDRARGQLASIETGGVSPVMAAIKDKAEKLIAAYQAFTTSMKGSEQGTTISQDQGAIDKTAAALAEAQNQWDSLAGDWTDTETAYHDAYQRLIDAMAARAQDALDTYQKERETKAQLAKKVVQKDLNKVYADLRAGKITLQQAEKTINEILAPFGLSLADLGNVLDTSDLQDALGELKDAVDKLTAAIEGVKQAGGQTGAAGGSTGAGPGGLPGNTGGAQTAPGTSAHGATVPAGVAAHAAAPATITRAALAPTPMGRGTVGDSVVVQVFLEPSVNLDGQQVGTLVAPVVLTKFIDQATANGGKLFAGRVTS